MKKNNLKKIQIQPLKKISQSFYTFDVSEYLVDNGIYPIYFRSPYQEQSKLINDNYIRLVEMIKSGGGGTGSAIFKDGVLVSDVNWNDKPDITYIDNNIEINTTFLSGQKVSEVDLNDFAGGGTISSVFADGYKVNEVKWDDKVNIGDFNGIEDQIKWIINGDIPLVHLNLNGTIIDDFSEISQDKDGHYLKDYSLDSFSVDPGFLFTTTINRDKTEFLITHFKLDTDYIEFINVITKELLFKITNDNIIFNKPLQSNSIDYNDLSEVAQDKDGLFLKDYSLKDYVLKSYVDDQDKLLSDRIDDLSGGGSGVDTNLLFTSKDNRDKTELINTHTVVGVNNFEFINTDLEIVLDITNKNINFLKPISLNSVLIEDWTDLNDILSIGTGSIGFDTEVDKDNTISNNTWLQSNTNEFKILNPSLNSHIYLDIQKSTSSLKFNLFEIEWDRKITSFDEIALDFDGIKLSDVALTRSFVAVEDIYDYTTFKSGEKVNEVDYISGGGTSIGFDTQEDKDNTLNLNKHFVAGINHLQTVNTDAEVVMEIQNQLIIFNKPIKWNEITKNTWDEISIFKDGFFVSEVNWNDKANSNDVLVLSNVISNLGKNLLVINKTPTITNTTTKTVFIFNETINNTFKDKVSINNSQEFIFSEDTNNVNIVLRMNITSTTTKTMTVELYNSTDFVSEGSITNQIPSTNSGNFSTITYNALFSFKANKKYIFRYSFASNGGTISAKTTQLDFFSGSTTGGVASASTTDEITYTGNSGVGINDNLFLTKEDRDKNTKISSLWNVNDINKPSIWNKSSGHTMVEFDLGNKKLDFSSNKLISNGKTYIDMSEIAQDKNGLFLKDYDITSFGGGGTPEIKYIDKSYTPTTLEALIKIYFNDFTTIDKVESLSFEFFDTNSLSPSNFIINKNEMLYLKNKNVSSIYKTFPYNDIPYNLQFSLNIDHFIVIFTDVDGDGYFIPKDIERKITIGYYE